VTAAELGRADRLLAARSREELRLAQVASGLLLLLDAYRLTGRLPLEVQVQASRLRHAVKLVIQAEAARSAAPVPPSSAAQGLDPAAAALRAWIAAQPWTQPGPVGWVYLLCFRDPATGAHRPLQGNGCRGQYAGHYWGKPASSGLLKVLRRVGGGEFTELPWLVSYRRRPGQAGRHAPGHASRPDSQLLVEFHLVAQRDVEVAHHGDLRLQPSPTVLHRAGVQGGKAKAPPLVEAQAVQAVVGGDQPQPPTALLGRQPLDRLNQGGAHPPPLLGGVEGEDLALVAIHDVGEHAQQAPILGLGEEGWVVEGVDQLAAACRAGVVVLGEEGVDGRPVGGVAGSDPHRGDLLNRDNASIGLPDAPTNSRSLQHWTDDLVRRIRQHRNPRWRGAGRLVQVALAAGLNFELAWLEYPATRGRERRLKNQGSAYRRCPLCRGTGGPLDPAAAVAAVQRSPLAHRRPSGRR
jgi:hypothetical protein